MIPTATTATFVCLKSHFFDAKVFLFRLDLSSFDVKSFSREEHVERVDLWNKVERFVVGCFAAEFPR